MRLLSKGYRSRAEDCIPSDDLGIRYWRSQSDIGRVPLRMWGRLIRRSRRSPIHSPDWPTIPDGLSSSLNASLRAQNPISEPRTTASQFPRLAERV